MKHMFAGELTFMSRPKGMALTEIKFGSNFNTGKVQYMQGMFYCCNNLTQLDLRNFNTNTVTDMSYMFAGNYYSSTAYYYTEFEILFGANFKAEQAQNLSYMFSYYRGDSIDLSSFNTINVTDMSYMFSSCYADYDIVYLETDNVTSMEGMFESSANFFGKLKQLDFGNFNTTKVTNMSKLFRSCDFINFKTTLNLTGLDTENVTNMESMFASCSRLTEIDLTPLNTQNVTNMASMFNHCWGLTNIIWGNFDTGSVTTMSNMFGELDELSELDLSCFDTTAVTTMIGMFGGSSSSYPSSLTKITFGPNFKTTNVTDMTSMFEYCSNITTLDLSFFDTSNVTSMLWMFRGCTSLRNLNICTFNTAKVEIFGHMFYECSSLEVLDLSSFNLSGYKYNQSLYNYNGITGMFNSCSNLKTIYVSDTYGDWSNVGGSNTFFRCNSLVGGNGTTYNSSYTDKTYARIDGGTSNPGYFTAIPTLKEYFSLYENNKEDVQSVTFDYAYKPEYSSIISSITPTSVASDGSSSIQMYRVLDSSTSKYDVYILSNHVIYEMQRSVSRFYKLTQLKEIVFNNYNSSKLTDMTLMFIDCSSLTSLDLSSFDTSNVTNMTQMFDGCSSLTSLDLSSFDTSNVTNMGGMFNSCTSLSSLTFGNTFNTSKVERMSEMFYNCTSLTNLDLSQFNTISVYSMDEMFRECRSLTSITFGNNFNTSSVKYMKYMFTYCSALTSLDLSTFDTGGVLDVSAIFRYCSKLTTIYVDEDLWSTASVTSSADMFTGCYKLVGGAGTTYNSSYTDLTYAHVDGGTSNPGYLTAK